MKGKVLAVTAAAFCAGLFASVAPDIATNVAAGLAEDSGLLVLNIVAVDKFAAMWAPTAATARRLERGRAHLGRYRKVARAEDWPYCDPACRRGGRADDIARIEGVTTVARSTASANANAVNRTLKRDRLPRELSARRNPNVSPSSESPPALIKPVPLGCDAAFSSVADPARAHVYKRCMA
jgi:hypothetical protein